MTILNKTIYGLLAATALAPLSALGVPAKPGFRPMIGQDGTTVTLQLIGDEHFSYYLTTDGLPVMETAEGIFAYAKAENGILISSGVTAHNPGMRCANEEAFVKGLEIRPVLEAGTLQNRARKAAGKKKVGGFPCQGKVKGLVILAEFSDLKFSSPTAAFDFKRAMNEEGYSDYGASGSARDYFIEQSQGRFTPDFDVIGPVALPQTMAFYGENDALLGKDPKVSEMVYDACKALSPQVDFSQYDYDNDGEVDLVFIIYAGYNEAQGGGSNTIWPQQGDIKNDGKNLRLNGKRIGRYACTSELRGYEGKTPDGIGTFCHEFSHCLGLYDHYDTQYSGYVGMGAWDLMDSGSYNNESRTPAGYSAYERETVGWIEIPELKEGAANLSLGNLLATDEAYKIVSPYNSDEFFILENRQQQGWDSALPGHGLVITHIDYDADVWKQNIINSARSGHPHLQIVPAGGQLALMNTAAYPGPSGNTEFSHASFPQATLWTGQLLEAPVTNIRENEGVITFNFRTYLDAPSSLSVGEITEHTALLSWGGIENAARYEIAVSSINEGHLAGEPIKERITLASGDSFLSDHYPFDDHHTFTLQLTAKGSKSAMGGLKVHLLSPEGKIMETKSITLRDYERTDYWVFGSSSAGYLEFEAASDVELISALLYNGNQENVLRKGEVPEASEYSFGRTYAASETSTLIDGLHSGREYVCRVKAINDEFNSESNSSLKVAFTTAGTPNPDDLSRVEDAASSSSNHTEIYDLNGYLLYSGASDSLNQAALNAGIYVIKSNGAIRKVVVR